MAVVRWCRKVISCRHWLVRAVLLFVAFICLRGQPLPRKLVPQTGIVATAGVCPDSLAPLGPVWYYTYGFEGDDLPGHHRVLLVPVHYDEPALRKVLRAHPGRWWLVGNEPNDPLQDNLSPAAYAGFYHRVASTARRIDPTCRLVPAGIANADWRWAQAFRDSYRVQYGHYPSVSAWNVHVYLLDPAKNSLDAQRFIARTEDFRRWMVQINEDEKPLLLSEYGVLIMPDGADETAIADYMREATVWLQDSELVQAWAWFASHTGGYFLGDLYDAESRPTLLGRTYAELSARLGAGER